MRESNSGPSTDKRETSELAVISPMASSANAMYTAIAGRIDGAYNLSGKRFTQRKVMAGADLIWLKKEVQTLPLKLRKVNKAHESLMYPVAPATMHPTSKPMIIEAFRMKGLPKSSTCGIIKSSQRDRRIRS